MFLACCMPPKGPTDIIVVPGAKCWRIIGRKRSGITTVYWLTDIKATLKLTTQLTTSVGRSGGIVTVHVATAIVIKQVVIIIP